MREVLDLHEELIDHEPTPVICEEVSLSRNLLTDQSLRDLLDCFDRLDVTVNSLDLSGNKLTKNSLVQLRRYLDDGEYERIGSIDLSNNHASVIRNASILELRQDNNIKVSYTKEGPRH